MCFFYNKKNDPEKTKKKHDLSDIQYNTLRNAGIKDRDIEYIHLIEDMKGDMLYRYLLQMKEEINIEKYVKKKKRAKRTNYI
jgi:hypothetical protein